MPHRAAFLIFVVVCTNSACASDVFYFFHFCRLLLYGKRIDCIKYGILVSENAARIRDIVIIIATQLLTTKFTLLPA